MLKKKYFEEVVKSYKNPTKKIYSYRNPWRILYFLVIKGKFHEINHRVCSAQNYKIMAWGSSRDDLKLKINSPCSCAKSHVKLYQDGVSEGYEIVCMDGSFHVHEYCLYNSEFLYNMLKGFDSTVYLSGRATRYDFLH